MDFYVVTFNIYSNNAWGHELVMINARATNSNSAIDKARKQLNEIRDYPSIRSVVATMVTEDHIKWAREE
jgi:hypothetical protein